MAVDYQEDRHLARDGFKVMDSDLHILEPADLWERYIDPAFSDRAPRGLTDITRGLGVRLEGQTYGHAAEGIGRERRDYSTYLQHEHYAEVERRNYDGIAMLGAMDREGVDLAVLYPSRGLLIASVPGLDPELFGAISRAYNDWLHDLCLTDPTRLYGAAMVPPTDVDVAVAEARRAAEDYGFKAIFLSADVYDQRGWDDPMYYPLWEECQRQRLVVGFHTTGSPTLRPGQAGGMFSTWMQLHTFTHAVPCMEGVAAFTAGGVLEAFPELKVAFLEANCSWAPWLLWRLDEHYELGGHIERPQLKMKPSEYFRRQCYVSIEADEDSAKGIEAFGLDDNIVFSTDFPHPDSKWPFAVESVLKLPLDDELKRKFLWDNTQVLYSLS
jgi:predicted TIM-barrel fold metal-dependent hydrolase